MGSTVVQPNNIAVKFRGRPEHEMPSVSKAQNRFMHAAAEGKVKDVPKSVGKDFVAADHGRKISKLPNHIKKHAKRMHKRGLISDKALKQMTEDR